MYAASRQLTAHPDDRVTPVIMDVTDWTQIQRAVESVGSLDILINNAGVSMPETTSAAGPRSNSISMSTSTAR
jgi:NADP-dependent 3-hydroxy acid dehydrogenase YdfG